MALTAKDYEKIKLMIEERIADIRVTREEFVNLSGNVTRLEIALENLAQAQKRTEERVEELAQAQKRTEERVEELAQAQKRTEERVEELAQAQKRTEQQVERLSRAMDEFRKAHESLVQAVASLSATIGYSIEDIGHELLPPYLARTYGVEVQNFLPYQVGPETDGFEFDYYATGKRHGKDVIVVGESKARITYGDVKEFHQRLQRFQKLSRLEIFAFIFGFRIDGAAVRKTQELGIVPIATYMLR